MAHSEFLARRYFPAIDGLRALSVLPVVFHHATPRPLAGALGRGPLGVDLFFAISGFLITTLLLREARRQGTIDLRSFYLRRAYRIFPAYYFVAFLHVVFALFVPPEVRAHFFASLPFFLTYTTNWLVDFGVPHAVLFSYAWSLAAEEQFYAFFPPVLKLAVRFKRHAHLAVTLFVSALLAFDACVEEGLFLANGLPHRIASSFPAPIGIGVLFATALDHPRTYRFLARVLTNPLVRAATLGLTLAAFTHGIPVTLAFFAFAALVAELALEERALSARLLALPSLRFLGRISYSIYLTHVAALGVARRVLPQLVERPVLLFLAALPLVVAFGAALHYGIEKPWIDRKLSIRPRTSRALSG